MVTQYLNVISSPVIDNSAAGGTAAHSQLDFAHGLDESNLWLVQMGNDLVIYALGTANSVTVSGWFESNTSAPLAEIIGGDSMTLDTGVSQLVAAMATYESNNPGFTPSAASMMPTDTTLQSTLAAAWHH